jgi:DNA-binding response OmpR family regulator
VEEATGHEPSYNQLRVHITRIRNKLRRTGMKVENLYGVGYRATKGSFEIMPDADEVAA